MYVAGHVADIQSMIPRHARHVGCCTEITRRSTHCKDALCPHLRNGAVDVVGLPGGLGGDLLDGTLEAVVPGLHGQHLLAGQQPPQVGHDVPGVVVGDVGAPASADALRTVHQHHGQNGQVPAGSMGIFGSKQSAHQMEISW